MLGFSHELEQFDKIGREGDTSGIESQSVISGSKHQLPQCMQVASTTSHELNLALVKKIEPPCKWTAPAARSFCHGFQASMVLREPRHDQTRFSKDSLSKKDCRSSFHQKDARCAVAERGKKCLLLPLCSSTSAAPSHSDYERSKQTDDAAD